MEKEKIWIIDVFLWSHKWHSPVLPDTPRDLNFLIFETNLNMLCMVIRPSDNQPFNCTTLVLEVMCMERSCTRVRPRHSPYSNNLCCTYDITSVGIIFKVFSYDTVICYDSNLSPPRGRVNVLWSGNFVYHHLECTPTYWPLSYSFRSLMTAMFAFFS